ncbi:MAG: thioesterase family protein [Acidimicrobiia bacterium]
MTFAQATGVVHRAGTTYTGVIQPGWDIFGVANGGYVMSIAARAMATEAKGRDLIAINGHFTSPGKPGPVTVEVSSVKSGGAVTTLRADVIGNDRILLATTASFGDPGRLIGTGEIIHASPPDLPPPGDCVRAEPSKKGPLPPPFMGKVAIYLHPDDASAFSGERTGLARIRGWFRLLQEETPDPMATVLAADAFPPAVFNTNLPLKWTPTLDLSVHIRDPRPRGWLRCQFRTRFVTGGLLEEDGDIWDEDGNLVAQSRQLALVPR